MKTLRFLLFINLLLFLISCGSNAELPTPKTYNILSLGDSYTIGQSVCETCRFPEQLKDSLQLEFIRDKFNTTVIAQTGWTTTDLKWAIEDANLNTDYDIVTLLIGVNNQFQGYPISLFEPEFNELVNTSITLTNNDKTNLIVIGFFDYINTQFGQAVGDENTTAEITAYNNYMKYYCLANGITYVDAQNLIFNGLIEPELLASDGLHPSELAYSNLVRQLLPLAKVIVLE